MTISFARFNLYLAAALGLMLFAGCKSPEERKKAEDKKELATLSLHLEVAEDGTDRNSPVPIFREKPVYVNVEKEPFLDQGAIEAASVVDALGGFSLRLKFNWQGTLILDGITTDNHKRRIAILAKFGKESRWLGAPIIQRRISDGILTFTPDATKEEAQRIAHGLNNLVGEVKKHDTL
jgi:preprotein translocase subunit SecD